jgi:hypothetical protein
MLLQCETEGDGWLRANTLESLAELNEGCLALIAAQAQVTRGNALLEQFAGEWQLLEPAGRGRAAGCLYLLLDVGFALPQRWQDSPDPPPGAPQQARFFTVSGSADLAHSVFVFAWHLCRCEPAAARLLLGMPASCGALLAACTLGQVRALASAHPQWLQPRWLRQPRMWREFLAAARTSDAASLERARLRGQTLLAAESRDMTPARLPRTAAPRLQARVPTVHALERAHAPVAGPPQ